MARSLLGISASGEAWDTVPPDAGGNAEASCTACSSSSQVRVTVGAGLLLCMGDAGIVARSIAGSALGCARAGMLLVQRIVEGSITIAGSNCGTGHATGKLLALE